MPAVPVQPMRRPRRLSAACVFAAVALAGHAAAVPIPWKNCGKAGDLLAIISDDASAWPPPVAAPASATATFDGAGNLLNLRIFLVHGLSWTFDSGPLATTTTAGFVSLPASFPVNLASPTLPIPPGPYNTLRTFARHDFLPVTVLSRANLGMQIDAPVATTVGLSFNGTPGFPLVPVAGSAYDVHVQMSESSGAGVFCLDLVVPFKTDAPFVTIPGAPVPALSPAGVLMLAAMLFATGLAFAHWCRRSAPCREPS